MKANELMIGDWVYNRNIDKPMQVYPMMFSQMFRQRPDAKTEDYNIFPIPLTAEILEKNGFHYTNQHTLKTSETYVLRLEQRGFDFTITIKLNDWFALDSYDDRVYRLAEISTGRWCVHDLQHALRLCGIEKEITL